jgi:tRNA threonylcarbamoyladenosine biosynthesis protein TsaE
MQKKFCLDEKNISQIADFIIKLLVKKKLLLIFGDLGSGKTTLVKEIGKLIAVKDNISSPSFNILNIYDSSIGEIYHYDFYRLNNKEELVHIDFYDALLSKICIIEWPDIIYKEMPKSVIKVYISFSGVNRIYKIFY